MNVATQKHLRKTLYWKGWATITLTAFLVALSLAYFYVIYLESFYYISEEDTYFFLVGGGYLAVAFYINYILYNGWSILKRCLEEEDMELLEVVFRKQRHFWMGITLMVLSSFVLFLGTVVVLLFLYE